MHSTTRLIGLPFSGIFLSLLGLDGRFGPSAAGRSTAPATPPHQVFARYEVRAVNVVGEARDPHAQPNTKLTLFCDKILTNAQVTLLAEIERDARALLAWEKACMENPKGFVDKHIERDTLLTYPGVVAALHVVEELHYGKVPRPASSVGNLDWAQVHGNVADIVAQMRRVGDDKTNHARVELQEPMAMKIDRLLKRIDGPAPVPTSHTEAVLEVVTAHAEEFIRLGFGPVSAAQHHVLCRWVVSAGYGDEVAAATDRVSAKRAASKAAPLDEAKLLTMVIVGRVDNSRTEIVTVDAAGVSTRYGVGDAVGDKCQKVVDLTADTRAVGAQVDVFIIARNDDGVAPYKRHLAGYPRLLVQRAAAARPTVDAVNAHAEDLFHKVTTAKPPFGGVDVPSPVALRHQEALNSGIKPMLHMKIDLPGRVSPLLTHEGMVTDPGTGAVKPAESKAPAIPLLTTAQVAVRVPELGHGRASHASALTEAVLFADFTVRARVADRAAWPMFFRRMDEGDTNLPQRTLAALRMVALDFAHARLAILYPSIVGADPEALQDLAGLLLEQIICGGTDRS